jgi:hypothetical protein
VNEVFECQGFDRVHVLDGESQVGKRSEVVLGELPSTVVQKPALRICVFMTCGTKPPRGYSRKGSISWKWSASPVTRISACCADIPT